MKKILPLLLFMQVALVNAQTTADVVKFEHTGGRAAYVKPGKLVNADSVGDLLSHFNQPKFRREADIVSVGITATCDDNSKTAVTQGENLSEAQKAILATADAGSEIYVTVDHKYKDVLKTRPRCYSSERKVEYAVTAGPETDAEFPGGKNDMNRYFRETVIEPVGKENQESASHANVHFTVNEQGKIIEPRIFKSSLDPEIDKLILEAVQNMPDWKPAENLKGEKIKQSFIINVVCTPQGC